MPPPLTSDEARRLDALERWRKEHEADHMRLRADLTEKVADMTDAAIRHVERVVADGLKPLGELDRRFNVLESQNATQTTILHQQNDVLAETRNELVANRIEREKRVAADEAKAKLEKDEKDRRDAELAAKEARTKRLAVYVTVLGILIGGLVTIIVAAINSHAGKPAVEPPPHAEQAPAKD